MAEKITIALEDDLDGGPADQTVRFRLGGAEYEIDLSKKNAAALRKKLAPPLSMPAWLGGDGAANPGVPQRAGSTARPSGRGRKATASWSATVGASPPASSNSIRLPSKESDQLVCRWSQLPCLALRTSSCASRSLHLPPRDDKLHSDLADDRMWTES